MELKILAQAQDVSEHMLVLAANCAEDWFPPETPMQTDEFIDRLCDAYLNDEGWDIEQLDSSAVRVLVRAARQARREMM